MGMKLPDDNTLEQKFTTFEVEMNRYEMATGNQLPESAKVGILVATTTGRLHEHLVLNMNDTTTYAQVRVTIMNYIKSKKLSTKAMKQTTDGISPMDVDAIDKGKGKTKGNKKYCTICQKEGHWTSECYYNPHGKNYVPGKAKGKNNYKGGKQNYDGGKKGTGYGKNNYKGKDKGKSKGKRQRKLQGQEGHPRRGG